MSQDETSGADIIRPNFNRVQVREVRFGELVHGRALDVVSEWYVNAREVLLVNNGKGDRLPSVRIAQKRRPIPMPHQEDAKLLQRMKKAKEKMLAVKTAGGDGWLNINAIEKVAQRHRLWLFPQTDETTVQFVGGRSVTILEDNKDLQARIAVARKAKIERFPR